MNIKNINNNRLNYYKNLQQQQQIILHTQNAHPVNYENFNNNALNEKLNASNLDNNIKNINNISIQGESSNNNKKIKNEVNYFINNEGEVEMEDLNVANFAVNANDNNIFNFNNVNNAQSLISFSSKKNDINPDNLLLNKNKYDINFKKESKNILIKF
jgi:hypothetical protein